MQKNVPEHIRKARIKQDRKDRESPLRKLDKKLSDEKLSAVLTVIFIVLTIMALSGGVTLVVYVF